MIIHLFDFIYELLAFIILFNVNVNRMNEKNNIYNTYLSLNLNNRKMSLEFNHFENPKTAIIRLLRSQGCCSDSNKK